MRMFSEPIKFGKYESVLEPKEGQDVTIACEVRGRPEPTVQWYFDEIRLDNDISSELCCVDQ